MSPIRVPRLTASRPSEFVTPNFEERRMDWFEQLTGFRESNYEETRAKLKVDAGRLRSLVNGKSYGVGEFELVPLQTLRERVRSLGGPSGRLKASVARG